MHIVGETDMELESIAPNEKSKELKKHIATIHCSNSLSLMQRKIANVLLYNAYKNLLTYDSHIITIPHLCKILGYNSHNYDALKDALRALISTVIEWNLVDNQRECWTASSVLASVQIEGTECRYSYSHHMRQMLHLPSVYGRINLSIQSRFKSSYGLALYENCSRYKNIPQTQWFGLEDFRKLMGVNHGEYEIFRDLKRRVIDKAVEEVNCYSDIIVTPEFKKVNRRVTAIKFTIKARAKKQRLGLVDDDSNVEQQKKTEVDSLVHRLHAEFGVAHQVAKVIVLQHTPEYVDRKIMEVLSSESFKKGKINNLAAFILTAIKNDFQPPKSGAELYIKLKRDKKNTEDALNKEKEAKMKAYNKYINNEFDKTINSFYEKDLNTLIHNFFESQRESNAFMYKMIKGWYDEDGINSPPLLGCLKEYMIKNNQYKLPCTYEEFTEAGNNESQEVIKEV